MSSLSLATLDSDADRRSDTAWNGTGLAAAARAPVLCAGIGMRRRVRIDFAADGASDVRRLRARHGRRDRRRTAEVWSVPGAVGALHHPRADGMAGSRHAVRACASALVSGRGSRDDTGSPHGGCPAHGVCGGAVCRLPARIGQVADKWFLRACMGVIEGLEAIGGVDGWVQVTGCLFDEARGGTPATSIGSTTRSELSVSQSSASGVPMHRRASGVPLATLDPADTCSPAHRCKR